MQLKRVFCLMPRHLYMFVRGTQKEIGVPSHSYRAGSQNCCLWALLTQLIGDFKDLLLLHGKGVSLAPLLNPLQRRG